MVDRSIRPLFPDGMRNEVQIVLTALSFDKENDPEFLALVGASAAVAISDIPLETILAGVKVGMIDDKIVVNPLLTENGKNDLDMTVSITGDGKIAMIEAGAKEIPETKIKEAIKLAQKESTKIVKLIEDLQKKVGKSKKTIEIHTIPEKIYFLVEKKAFPEIKKLIANYQDKLFFDQNIDLLKENITPELVKSLNEDGTKDEKELEKSIAESIEKLVKIAVRNLFVTEGKRIDKRKIDEIRPLQIEVGVLPRTHGSAIFARGWTQGLTTATLGAPGSAMIMEGMEYEEIETKKHYMHFYYFPPFSTG